MTNGTPSYIRFGRDVMENITKRMAILYLTNPTEGDIYRA